MLLPHIKDILMFSTFVRIFLKRVTRVTSVLFTQILACNNKIPLFILEEHRLIMAKWRLNFQKWQKPLKNFKITVHQMQKRQIILLFDLRSQVEGIMLVTPKNHLSQLC